MLIGLFILRQLRLDRFTIGCRCAHLPGLINFGESGIGFSVQGRLDRRLATELFCRKRFAAASPLKIRQRFVAGCVNQLAILGTACRLDLPGERLVSELNLIFSVEPPPGFAQNRNCRGRIDGAQALGRGDNR